MTDGNTERTRQTLEALAMVDYWRTEAEQQRTRAEAAEQEKHDAMDDAAELAQSCKELEAKLAAIRAHLTSIDWQAIRQIAEDLRVQEDSVAADLGSVIEAAWEAHKP